MVACLIVLLVLFQIFSDFSSAEEIPWSYNGDLGPDHWCEIQVEGNQCCGSRQSPILIQHDEAVQSDFILSLNGMDTMWDYLTLNNDGHTAMLRVSDTFCKPYLRYFSWDPDTLSDTYLFEQLHFHFGGNESVGSEHVIDGVRAPMEMHVVFYNSKYESFAFAKNFSDGVVVVGVLFKISSHNSNFNPIVDALSDIKYAEQQTTIRPGFPLEHLLPKDTSSAYSYLGSLTTPVCNEAVTWFVLKHHVPISDLQLVNYRLLRTVTVEGKHSVDEFRRVNIDTDTFMFNNFRPTQPLNGRTVYYHHMSALNLKRSIANSHCSSK